MSASHSDSFTLSISKQELAELPRASFRGTIRLIETEAEIGAAVGELRAAAGVIGFDTETRPSFRKGQSHLVSLLQLSTRSCCFLFRLNKTGLTTPLIDLLNDANITKVGVSIHDDFHNLGKLAEIAPDGFIELQQFVKDFRIADNSLSRIYAILFGQRISKGQRLTNWEADELTPHQQAYAALDALACVEIYEALTSGSFRPEESPFIKYPEPPAPETDGDSDTPSTDPNSPAI